MKKMLFGITLIIIVFLVIFPFIEIDTGKSIIRFSYSEDWSEYENNACYDESYFYNEDKNVSIHNFNMKKFLFFKFFILDYKKGNICATEYLLEESYINDFLDNAIIKYKSDDIDLKSLIKDKEAIVKNKKYLGNNYETWIEYILNDEHEIMYIFSVDDLLVIQVGLSDEGPKFIAYK